jgi:hypothetical protein
LTRLLWMSAGSGERLLFFHLPCATLLPVEMDGFFLHIDCSVALPGNGEFLKQRKVRLLTEIFGGMTDSTEEIGTTEDARYASTGAFVRARFGSSTKMEP